MRFIKAKAIYNHRLGPHRHIRPLPEEKDKVILVKSNDVVLISKGMN